MVAIRNAVALFCTLSLLFSATPVAAKEHAISHHVHSHTHDLSHGHSHEKSHKHHKHGHHDPHGGKELNHEKWKGYKIRLNKPKLCDPKVKQYSGYVDTPDNKHLFFWFFEARHNPKKAPFTVWLNGGPGCSSMIGLFEELGPCRVNEHGEAKVNKHSWNEASNILFLDQPAAVGFSYGTSDVNTTPKAGKDVYAFLQIFFEHFKEYRHLPFHFFGESYGGHYIPNFSRIIVENNKKIKQGKAEGHIINIKSAGVGNGWTKGLVQYKYYPIYACNNDYGPVLDKETCKKSLEDYETKCKPKLQQCLKNPKDLKTCVEAEDICQEVTFGPFYEKSDRNYYDIREPRNWTIPNQWETIYLQNDKIKQALGVDPKLQYQSCNDKINENFYNQADHDLNFDQHIGYLLDNDVRVLLYAGTADFICNTLGFSAMADQIKWKGGKGYKKAKFHPWRVDGHGHVVGEAKHYKNLVYATIKDAGHEVPYYKPKESLYMFKRWINDKPFYQH
ncbi:uncharacterized protein VTP21DRAFT_7840 [Calcarisporiella thermophila]|uniref:uncharacterized protein n=1 Tax=Calcarisporiella thermophila TaxID=911321 RepID=UPI0037449B04